MLASDVARDKAKARLEALENGPKYRCENGHVFGSIIGEAIIGHDCYQCWDEGRGVHSSIGRAD